MEPLGRMEDSIKDRSKISFQDIIEKFKTPSVRLRGGLLGELEKDRRKKEVSKNADLLLETLRKYGLQRDNHSFTVSNVLRTIKGFIDKGTISYEQISNKLIGDIGFHVGSPFPACKKKALELHKKLLELEK